MKAAFRGAYNFNLDIDRLSNVVSIMAYDGDFKPAFEFVQREINKHTRIRDFILKENLIKAFYLIYFNVFDNYISTSEEELNKGYADLVLKPFYQKFKDIKFGYLIEFKYIKREVPADEIQPLIDKNVSEAKIQLEKYAEDEFARVMFGLPPYGLVTLKKVIVVFHGWDLVYCEEG